MNLRMKINCASVYMHARSVINNTQILTAHDGNSKKTLKTIILIS